MSERRGGERQRIMVISFWPCFQAESDLPVRECSQVDIESLVLQESLLPTECKKEYTEPGLFQNMV